jgi:hypothetical protein
MNEISVSVIDRCGGVSNGRKQKVVKMRKVLGAVRSNLNRFDCPTGWPIGRVIGNLIGRDSVVSFIRIDD